MNLRGCNSAHNKGQRTVLTLKPPKLIPLDSLSWWLFLVTPLSLNMKSIKSGLSKALGEKICRRTPEIKSWWGTESILPDGETCGYSPCSDSKHLEMFEHRGGMHSSEWVHPPAWSETGLEPRSLFAWSLLQSLSISLRFQAQSFQL